MKFVVTNAVLSNTGDAAIYEAIVTSLTSAFDGDAEIRVCDANARVTQKLYPQWQISQQLTVSPPREPARLRWHLQQIRRLLVRALAKRGSEAKLIRAVLSAPVVRRSQFARSLTALESADVVVSSGGTYLVDHYDFSPRVDEFKLVKSLGRPLVLWTQSLGPFTNARSRRLAYEGLPLADAVYFRDDRSRRAWATVTPLPVLSAVVPDVVFALSPPATRRAATPRRAMISVREWSTGIDSTPLDHHVYDASMRQFAICLEEAKFQVDALSTCQGVREYPHDDSRVADRIFAGTNTTVNRDFHTPTMLLAEVGEAAAVVTTRMHLSIMAILAQVPVIAVAYEFKTIELFTSLGLASNVVAIERLTPEWAVTAVQRLVERPDAFVVPDERLAGVAYAAGIPARSLHEKLRTGWFRE